MIGGLVMSGTGELGLGNLVDATLANAYSFRLQPVSELFGLNRSKSYAFAWEVI